MSFRKFLLKKNLVIIFNKSDLDNFEKKNQNGKANTLYRKNSKISISCKDKSKNLNMLRRLIKFIDSNLVV